MEDALVARAAHPSLRGRVGRLWGYSQHSPVTVRQREPVSPGVVLIVGLETELGLVDPAHPESAPRRLRSFVAGLDDACAVIEYTGAMRGVQVDLSPLAARMILREPMHGLAREVVPLEDLLGATGRRLEERVVEAGTWEERFAAVERALGTRLADADPPPADAERAWRRLVATRGRLRVEELAAELGCSRKHLAARFRDHVGLPPKLVARILRFRHASDLLEAPGPIRLAELAAACGYYDQAHLDRDFRDLAGVPPTTYRADRRVTFVQEAGAVTS